MRLCTSPQKLDAAGDVAPTLPEFGGGELLPVPPVADPGAGGGPALRSACAPSSPALLINLGVGVELVSDTSRVVSPKDDAGGGSSGGDNNGITPFSSLFSEASRGLSLDEPIEDE